jgi:hypothetical protein
MSKELPPGHPVSAHKDEVGEIMHRWKHHDPKALHSGRGKGGKEGKVVKSQDQAIAIALSMTGKSKGKTSNHSERLASMGYSEDVAQEVASMLDGTFDFTRCVRPDGTAFGTKGNCTAPNRPAGPSKKELLAKADSLMSGGRRNSRKIQEIARRLREKAEATNFSEDALDFTTCERPNGSRYGTGGKCRKGTEVSADEMSAIDQLAGMLPKGEKILDSSGKSHTAAGRPVKKQLDDLLKREQEARSKGDTEGARKLMREHMALVKEMNASSKGSKRSLKEPGSDVQQMQLKRLQDRLDDAVTIKEQQRIFEGIKILQQRMKG